MKNAFKFFQIMLLASVCFCSSGCWFLLIGGAGAVGGYAVTRDTFEGVSSKGQDELMTAAHKVVSIMGTISDEEPKEGRLEGTVNGAHITVTIVQINLTSSKLHVKARKDMLPALGIAQEVYTKIMNQLE